jgi:hypothetical protein
MTDFSGQKDHLGRLLADVRSSSVPLSYQPTIQNALG